MFRTLPTLFLLARELFYRSCPIFFSSESIVYVRFKELASLGPGARVHGLGLGFALNPKVNPKPLKPLYPGVLLGFWNQG